MTSLQTPTPHRTGVGLNALALPDLYRELSQTGLVRRLLELARDEDLGAVDSPWRGRASLDKASAWGGDITTAACIDPSLIGRAMLVMRVAGVVSGLAAMPELVSLFAPGSKFDAATTDGQHVGAGTVLGTIHGPMDEILELERTMINLISRLCGVATNTAEYHRAMTTGTKPIRANLYDTRKTTPGMRVLEKYAVRCGGGHCHRIGLYDAVLIKDNHLAGVRRVELAAFVQQAVTKARLLSSHCPPSFVEVEVDSLDQFRALLTLPAGTIDIVLLDNMNVAMLCEAVALRDAQGPRLELEASGGVNLGTIRTIAESGVDRISVGALTHSAISLDIGLDIETTA